MEIQEGTAVLPDATKKRSETNYAIQYIDSTGQIAIADVHLWGEVKTLSAQLHSKGCKVTRVMRVTGYFYPQEKTVLSF